MNEKAEDNQKPTIYNKNNIQFIRLIILLIRSLLKTDITTLNSQSFANLFFNMEVAYTDQSKY